MIGRVLLRLPARSRLLRLPLSQCQNETPLRTSFVLSVRAYATPGRPKRVVGEPSRPVKRAVKKTAAQPADGSSTAEKHLAAKKSAAAKKTRKTLTPEQAAAKEEQAAAKKAAAKAAAKERREQQKVVRQKRKANAEVEAKKVKVKELKKAALSPPNKPRASAFNVFMAEKMRELMKQRSDTNPKEYLVLASRQVVQMWKDATAADIEHYNHLAIQQREESYAEYKQWVESHAPEEILAANNARAKLRRQISLEKGHRTTWPPIEDPRQVKKPVTAYLQFSINRNASGDFKNISLPERSRLIAREWRDLSADEKKKYASLSQQEKDRYSSKFTDTYGQSPPQLSNGQPQAVAAAA